MLLSESDIAKIEKVKHTVQAAVFTPIGIKDLCLISGMSRTKLQLSFTFLYQYSIFHYHLVISMEYAKARLEDGSSVKEIAILLGYSSTEHFNRAFRKIFKKSPNKFLLR